MNETRILQKPSVMTGKDCYGIRRSGADIFIIFGQELIFLLFLARSWYYDGADIKCNGGDVQTHH